MSQEANAPGIPFRVRRKGGSAKALSLEVEGVHGGAIWVPLSVILQRTPGADPDARYPEEIRVDSRWVEKTLRLAQAYAARVAGRPGRAAGDFLFTTVEPEMVADRTTLTHCSYELERARVDAQLEMEDVACLLGLPRQVVSKVERRELLFQSVSMYDKAVEAIRAEAMRRESLLPAGLRAELVRRRRSS